ncbi:SdpI family protein [Rhodococcoides trifolii]|uniref:SdpI family protein n=1 Tax=Rhodococcoides trifolii TaxID=908250 RepID=UPI001E659AE0|nr:SdpI family protein [Rhodococcus trifolii]
MIAAIVLLVCAVFVGSVAVLALARKLPRNRFAGVRTPASMSSDDAFAVANRVAGPTTAAAALFLVFGAIASLAFGGWAASGAVLVCVAAALVIAGMGGSMGARAAAALPKPEAAGCGHACTSCSLKDACQPS